MVGGNGERDLHVVEVVGAATQIRVEPVEKRVLAVGSVVGVRGERHADHTAARDPDLDCPSQRFELAREDAIHT